ncbi:MAG: 50S ribosomal protein L25/general stress protein Ctc [Panacagrimonas sp.]
MKQEFVVMAEPRTVQGTGASRRLRHAGKVPAIVYGAKKDPEMITLDHNELWKNLKHEAFYSNVLTLKVGESSQDVVLKDLHRHPVREQVLHVDLQRVQSDVALRMRIPLHFKGEDIAPGVKTGGGMLEHLMNDVEVECLPKHLPQFIEVDVTQMQVGESIHLSQLSIPEGVSLIELKHDNDAAVVAIHLPRAARGADADADEAGDSAEDGASDEA